MRHSFFYLIILFLIVQGFRVPWEDHAPNPKFLAHHEKAWSYQTPSTEAEGDEEEDDE